MGMKYLLIMHFSFCVLRNLRGDYNVPMLIHANNNIK